MNRSFALRIPFPSFSRLACLCFLTSAAIFISGCGINPVTGARELQIIPESREVDLGGKSYLPAQQSQGGEYILDPALSNYVSDLGQHIARNSDRPQLPYEFVVLNNSVPNAWAMPGGKIAVNRGLLTGLDNEAELAAVIAHEIVHAAARHGAKAMERGMLLQAGALGIGLAASGNRYGDLLVGSAMVGASLINQTYSREHELESDYYGMIYMSRSGFDPEAAITLQEKFVKLSEKKSHNWLEGLFASHPPSQERVDANRRTLATLPPTGQLGKERYAGIIAGLKKNEPAYKKYDEALDAFQDKDYDLARQKAQQAIAGEPREALFYSLVGDTWAKEKQHSRAIDFYDQAISRNDRYYRFYLQRGVVRRELGMQAAARDDFERANSLMPTATASHGLGMLALKENRQREAMDYFRMAADSDSDVGKQSRRQLAFLEMSENPEKYIAVGFQPYGNDIYLVVENRAPITVRHLEVMVRVFLDRSSQLGSELVQIPFGLRPGERQTVATRIRIKPGDLPRISIDHSILGVDPERP